MSDELYKAYLAGLIDGEGSILLEHAHSNEYRSPAVSISTTSLELFDGLVEKYGGTISKKHEREGCKTAYQYKVKTNKALKMLEDILPYLKHQQKIARAKHLVNKYKTVTQRNGKYNEEQLKNKIKFEEEFFEL